MPFGHQGQPVRLLSNLVVAVLLLLSLASAAIWVGSYWVFDSVVCTAVGKDGKWTSAETYRVAFASGGATFNNYWIAVSPRALAAGRGVPRSLTKPVGVTFERASAPATGYPQPHPMAPASRWTEWGFSYYRLIDRSNDDYRQRGLDLVVPCWLLTISSAVAPATWLVVRFKWWRRGTRAKRGLCVRCGYDLRATPGRCPECGAEPTVVRGAGAAEAPARAGGRDDGRPLPAGGNP